MAAATAKAAAPPDYSVSANGPVGKGVWGDLDGHVTTSPWGTGVASWHETALDARTVDGGEALTFALHQPDSPDASAVLDQVSFFVDVRGPTHVQLDFDGDVRNGSGADFALDLTGLTGGPLRQDVKVTIDFDAQQIRVGAKAYGVDNAQAAAFFQAAGDATQLTVGAGSGAFTLRDVSVSHHEVVHDGSAVLDWIQTALDTIAHTSATPIYASRALAMQSLAVMDTLSAMKGEAGQLVSLDAPHGASAEAAAIAAAHRVLVELFPTEKAALDQKMAESLAQLGGHGVAAGQAFGDAVAAAVCAVRAHDGWDAQVAYQGPDAPNAWQPTPPAYADPLAPQWGQVDPFTLASGDQFRPPAPPAPGSQAYADAYNLTKDLGARDSATRTADQTEIARFWADGSGSYTPPGHWDAIAEQLAGEQHFGLEASAKLFAMLNLALADAGIACWDAKYAYAAWRPITAILNGDADGDPLTTGDPSWTPLLSTPPFPEYTSGHSTFSAAASAILTQVFGEHVSFDTTSLTAPGVVRHYDSFEQAAGEAGMSRIYGGIHFMFANLEGLACGNQVGEWVLETFGRTGDQRAPSLVVDQKSGEALSGTPVLTGVAVDNASALHLISVSLDGGAARTVAVDDHGRFSLSLGQLFGPLADGEHHLLFSAADAAGNTSTNDWAFTWGAHTTAAAAPAPSSAEAPVPADHLDLLHQGATHFHGQPFYDYLL